MDEEEEKHLWNSFEAVLNPLLREYGKIKRDFVKENDEDKTLVIRSYNEWVEKAKLWASLSAKPVDREEIIQAVIKHTKLVSDLLVDRDLKMLNEYLLLELNIPEFDQEELKNLTERLELELNPSIEALKKLKDSAPGDLKDLQNWKSKIADLRSKHYNQALQIIDTITSSLVIPSKGDDNLDHLKEVFASVAYLEEEVPEFLIEIQQMDKSNLLDRQEKIAHCRELVEEVHKIIGDLRLTPELGDRIHKLSQQMELILLEIKDLI